MKFKRAASLDVTTISPIFYSLYYLLGFIHSISFLMFAKLFSVSVGIVGSFAPESLRDWFERWLV